MILTVSEKGVKKPGKEEGSGWKYITIGTIPTSFKTLEKKVLTWGKGEGAYICSNEM